ncbi:FAD:protein FMN transferase [Treponema sp.]|uniref:FAD:protein FMN transferase n=1 Tax=Treponema sp. TaxID=166 RepID=UPI00298EA5AC|nr:FAD:protein FMN transferase [Treponema sp.]MCR5614147.1 FAD:protein FMN transferase [Treponema sp.]
MKKINFNIIKRFAFLFVAAGLINSCAKQNMPPQTEFVFGTVCTVNLFSDGTPELYGEVFTILNQLDNKFSVNKESSSISFINKNAGQYPCVVSREVYEVLEFSKEMAEKTDNAFNPVMGALINLWGVGTDHQRVPSDDEIEEAKKHCNPESLVLRTEIIPDDGEGYFVELTDSKARIDLGGIVKGYAADVIAEFLKERGVKGCVIDLGGNIYVFGDKDIASTMWKIGIKNPLEPTAKPVKTILLKEGSVVTSGNYERYFVQDGVRYHHIIDGRTGRPSESGLASVTVVYKKSAVCDALSTAMFVRGMDSELEQKFVKEGIQFIYVTQEGKVVESKVENIR